MNLLVISGLVSGVLSAVCYLPYIRDILAGTTKPERATWFIWSILTSILFFAQASKGATNSLWLTGVQALGVIIIFLLALKFGEGGVERRDIYALIAAGIGLIAWFFTREAAVALWITIGIDFAGASLTIAKAYRDPGSETASAWIISSIAGIFGALAVGSFSINLLAFPIYVFIINLSVFMAILLGRRNKSTN